MYKRLMGALILSGKIVSAQPVPAIVVKNDTTANPVFTLGEVVVTGERNKPINSSLSAHTIQDLAKNDVSKALNLLPGVNLSSVGPRNEAMVYIRGFDLRQVPLLIDGINNITDRNYTLVEGYPEAGRNYFVNLVYRL